MQSQANGLDAVVLLVQNLRVAAGASLRVLGNRPAIFIASSAVNIDGIVTVSPDPTNVPRRDQARAATISRVRS